MASRSSLLLLLTALFVHAQAAHPVLLRANRLLDVENGRIVSPGEVLVRGNRIAEAGSTVSRPAGVDVVDLGDVTLMPGLVDVHVHLFLHP